jgi:MFS superfamily sulfate permease-like transporter
LAPHFKWVHFLTLPGFVLLPWQLHWANAFHNALDAAWLHAILASQPKVVLTLLQERLVQITLPSLLLFTLWLGLLIAWWRVDAHSPKRALPRNQSWRIPTIALAVLLAGCILILQQPLPTEAPNFVKALQHFFWFGYTASHASALSQPWPFGFYISLIQLFFLRV